MDLLSNKEMELGLSSISRAFDTDEAMCNYFEKIGFFSNGHYDYQSHRLIRSQCNVLPNNILNILAKNNGADVLMGIFADINRVYVAVNKSIYLWDFSKGTNGSYILLPPFSSKISCVSLVNVKHNVLIDDICYILVVATQNEICLVGLGFENGNICSGEIKAYPTHYNVATDDSKVCKIIGDRNGRIFMGCNDGKIYEFQYSVRYSFFLYHCCYISVFFVVFCFFFFFFFFFRFAFVLHCNHPCTIMIISVLIVLFVLFGFSVRERIFR